LAIKLAFSIQDSGFSKEEEKAESRVESGAKPPRKGKLKADS